MKQLPFFFHFLIFILVFNSNSTAQFSLCGNSIFADACSDASTPSICEIDGISGNLVGYTANAFDLTTMLNFCGPNTMVSNSVWIGFTPIISDLELFFDISNCSNPNGIQAAIIETDCSTFATTLTCVNGTSSSFLLVASGLIPGNPYYIFLDGFAGSTCDWEISVEVGLPAPSISVLLSGGLICESGQSTTLTANVNPSNGNYIYRWFDSSGDLIPNETSSSLTTSTIGQYTVEVRDVNNCCPAEATSTVAIAANPPVATLLNTPASLDLDCTQTGMVTLEADAFVASGNAQYFWLDPNGLAPCGTLQNCETVDVSIPGTYTFIVLDLDTGCSDEVTAEVTDIFGTCCPNILDVDGTPIANGFYTAHTKVHSSSSVINGTTVFFEAGTEICLDPNFEVELGAVFEAKINDCQ